MGKSKYTRCQEEYSNRHWWWHHRGQHWISKPIIVAIGGGFELALACDIRIASENSKFGVFEVRCGLHQGDGGIVRLVAIAGLATALDLSNTKQFPYTSFIYTIKQTRCGQYPDRHGMNISKKISIIIPCRLFSVHSLWQDAQRFNEWFLRSSLRNSCLTSVYRKNSTVPVLM